MKEKNEFDYETHMPISDLQRIFKLENISVILNNFDEICLYQLTYLSEEYED